MNKMLMILGLACLSSTSLAKQGSSGEEEVMYFSSQETLAILGDQQQGVEAVVFISSRHAENMLGDNGETFLNLEDLNSMPATAAGATEKIIYINANQAEKLLGTP